jgi:hypothetical protein
MSEQGNLKIEKIDFSDDLKDPIRLLNYEWLQKYFRIEEGGAPWKNGLTELI